ncbi:MAG TPA: hypothetical protein EYN79_08955 [Planctomycetes bacterium]|nr:hypothetical protein [Planctomycetota bacterium]HIN79499.1 hypothetical protein [Planctomycetota bacterium]
MFEGLNREQRVAVETLKGPLIVVAGPGSGKTRVMTHRISHLIACGIAPGSILAITFTNKAADEMLRRTLLLLDHPEPPEGVPGFLEASGFGISAESPVIRTFHSFCSRILRRDLYRIEPYSGDFSIYDTTDQTQLHNEVLASLELDRTTFPARAGLSTISNWKNWMISPDEAQEKATTFRDRELVRIFRSYQQELERRNALDFDDLLLLMLRLLREHPDVLTRYRARFQHLMIDEFQDTNRPQYLIARLLSVEHRNICITGDPDQSIYSWRGANPDNFRRFQEDFPEYKTVHLNRNYRSTPQIISVASRLTSDHLGERRLYTENPDGEDVKVVEVSDERAEARKIASSVANWSAEGTPLSEIAILYRINALSRAIEEELVRNHYPYAVIGGTGFYERKEIKDILAYLRAARFPRDEVALRRIVNVPPRGIGKISFERLVDSARDRGMDLGEAIRDKEVVSAVRGKARKGLTDLVKVLDDLARLEDRPLPEQVEAAIEASGYVNHLERSEPESWQERTRNLEELVTAAAETEEILQAAATDDDDIDPLIVFLERISLVTDVSFFEERDARVSMMTLHAAKGLEFNRVVIVGVEETLIPHSRHIEGGGLDEERRLLYVGITRARHEAVLTYTTWRRRFQEREPRLPSSFLNELEGEGICFQRAGSSLGIISVEDQRSGLTERLEDPFWEDDEMQVGVWIHHDLLGRGIISATSGRGTSKRISVRFEACGEKQLVVAYAPLKVISPPDEEWEPC